MATIVASASGGNWGANGTWVGGVVPTAADDVQLSSSSGNVTINGGSCRSLDCTGYTGTLTHNAGTSLVIGDSTAGAGNVALKLVSGMTYTLGNAATSSIAFVSTSSTTQTITTGGKTLGNWTVNGVGSSYQLTDGNTTGSTAGVTLIAGTLDTNSQTCSWGAFLSSNSNTRTLTLGSSSIAITATNGNAWDISTGANLLLNAGTSTITLTGTAFFVAGSKTYNNVVLTGSGGVGMSGGGTFANLTRTGTAAKTDLLSISGSFTVTGTFTVNGNSTINRILVTSNTLGTARTVTSANNSITNADFRDITGAGTANWDLSAIPGNSGDCGGNTGITFTPATTQTWSGTSGGTWSANAWTSRVPLPQDDVIINAAFSASQTVTADMPRLGRDINWTGTTGAPAWSAGVSGTGGGSIYGSLTLVSGITHSGTGRITLSGRGNHTLTNAGTTYVNSFFIAAPGGTYTLQDAFTSTALLQVDNGTFDAGTSNVTVANFVSNSGTSRLLKLGSGVWTVTGTGSGVWVTGSSGLSVNAGTSTINMANTSATGKSFQGGGFVFHDLMITGGGTGAVTVSGNNTFNTFTVNAPKTVTFTAGSTQTVSQFIAAGSAGNVITIRSSSAGSPAILSKASGIVSCDYLSLQDSIATGGATWYAGANSTNVSGNSGWNFSTAAVRHWVGGTDTWDATAGTKWAITSGAPGGYAAPTASDNVYIDANSGSGTVTLSSSSVARSLDCTGFTGTLSHPAATTLSLGDATAGIGNVALKLVSGMTYTLGSATTSAISFISTSATQQTITTGGKTLGNWTVNGVGSSYQLADANTTGSAATVTFTNGTLDTNSQACNWGIFTTNPGNVRVLTLGSSSIQLAASGTAFNVNGTNLGVTANTAVMTFTGSNAAAAFSGVARNWNGLSLVFNSAGNCAVGFGTFLNITRNGTSAKTDSFALANVTVTGTLTLNGNSATNRLLVLGNGTLGTPLTVTAATVSVSNADFRDITAAGTANWDLSAIPGNSGDCGGNSDITFTPAATQTWSGTSGGNWASNAWTSRVPLPQDDVIINASFSAGQTVSVNMPRMGRNIDWTGATGNPTFNMGQANQTLYGSLTLIAGMAFSQSQTLIFEGRGSYTLTNAGKTFSANVNVQMIGGTLTLQDAYSNNSGALFFVNGTFTANDQNLSGVAFSSSNSNTRTINMGSGTWSIIGLGGTLWNFANTTGLTLNPDTSTIAFTDPGSSSKTFAGGGKTYNNLSITGGGTGAVTVSGSNTFNTFTINAPKTVTFTANTTQTISNSFTAVGTAGNSITLNSSSAGTAATLSKASGTVAADYLSLQDSTATGGALWYAGANSSSVSNVSGWIMSAAPNTSGNMLLFR